MTDTQLPIMNPPEENTVADTAAAERAQKIAWIKAQLEKAVPITGTPAEKYLRDHRHLPGPYPISLCWAPHYQHKSDAPERPCLLFIVKNAQKEIVALQSLQLDLQTGMKASQTKFSSGSIGEGFVRLGVGIPSTLVIGEGVETTMTRGWVSNCDSYACLGSLRFVEPQECHKRVEILADSDKRDAARRLAREYAKKGLPAYVVTVPDSLGPKADLNDALRQAGLSAVRTAVEDAEQYSADPTSKGLKNFALEIGSDVEIAQRIIEQLEEIYGPLIISEGNVWRFHVSHWMAFESDHLARFVHRADGTIYMDVQGVAHTVRLSKSRVASILDALMKYRQEPNYFHMAARGINCENGFIQVHENGHAELQPHARQWRQRHVVRGKWQTNEELEKSANSLLAGYLQDAFKGDEDAVEKINLLGETAGCAALGWGTRVKSPKAIITYSEEGGTGKSTFLKLLRTLPNPEAVASVPAGKFGDEKYAYRLVGRILNAADELPDRAIRSDVFKRMITGEPIPARDVYRSATDFSPIALHVFSTNVLPSFSGGIDGGTARRLLPVEFTHVVPEDERNPELVERITHEESDLLLNFAVEGACRLIKQGDFTIPQSSKALLARWLVNADPVRGWVAERLEVTEYENIIAVAALYADFVTWAEARGMKRDFLPSVIAFGKRVPAAAPTLKPHRSDGSRYLNARLRDG